MTAPASRILTGDCRAILPTLRSESVHCVVTSPPYWGLRDYGVAGQMGLETSLGEHVDGMVQVFREVRRVLRKDGTLWLNYGDSYATSVNGRSAADTKALGNDDRTFRDKPFSTVGPVFRITAGKSRDDVDVGGWGQSDASLRWRGGDFLKPKDLCGIPWRVAFALQADGWYLRSDIIWSKPNPMPESVTDRPTKAHEYVFLMSKSERYFYDAQAIAEDGTGRSAGNAGPVKGAGNDDPFFRTREGFAAVADKEWRTRNKRTVWEIPTAPFPEAHFATFPPALIEPCILAGCPKDGTVLDPFGGAGTTGLVADRLGRSAILIELNPAYAAMAEKRISADAPLFAQVATVTNNSGATP
jgi:DNA modification methylase